MVYRSFNSYLHICVMGLLQNFENCSPNEVSNGWCGTLFIPRLNSHLFQPMFQYCRVWRKRNKHNSITGIIILYMPFHVPLLVNSCLWDIEGVPGKFDISFYDGTDGLKSYVGRHVYLCGSKFLKTVRSILSFCWVQHKKCIERNVYYAGLVTEHKKKTWDKNFQYAINVKCLMSVARDEKVWNIY